LENEERGLGAVAEEKNANPVEAKPLDLHLLLSDLTVHEAYDGFYEFGSRDFKREPEHRVWINARWRYRWDSDKLVVNGTELEPPVLEISPSNDSEVIELDHARHEFIVVHVVDKLFAALLDAVRRNDIEEAEVILQGHPNEGRTGPGGGDRFPITFGTLRLRHAPVQATDAAKRIVPPDPALKRLEKLLWWILMALIVIAVGLWRR
jgi:hypothetical protein